MVEPLELASQRFVSSRADALCFLQLKKSCSSARPIRLIAAPGSAHMSPYSNANQSLLRLQPKTAEWLGFGGNGRRFDHHE
jgi:hypothetical protein